MRGKDALPLHGVAHLRITPAYAGKRKSCAAQKTSAWDHPRMCGEKSTPVSASVCSSGSPPHMRGKVAVREFYLLDGGITPAYAGKRRCIIRRLLVHWDHPCVCGEKVEEHDAAFLARGSPPRMRGKDALPLHGVTHLRITPAYAGKSGLYRPERHNGRDHPRVCGEKSAFNALVVKLLGSPPRMRGKVCSYLLIGTCHQDHPRVCGEKACPARLCA